MHGEFFSGSPDCSRGTFCFLHQRKTAPCTFPLAQESLYLCERMDNNFFFFNFKNKAIQLKKDKLDDNSNNNSIITNIDKQAKENLLPKVKVVIIFLALGFTTFKCLRLKPTKHIKCKSLHAASVAMQFTSLSFLRLCLSNSPRGEGRTLKPSLTTGAWTDWMDSRSSQVRPLRRVRLL